MIEIAMEDAVRIGRQDRPDSVYPDKADARVRDGMMFPKISPRFTIPRGARIFTIGSCFARNIEERLDGFDLPTTTFTAPAAEREGRRPTGLLNEYSPGTMLQRISHALDGAGFGERAIVRFRDGYSDLLLPGSPPVSKERVMQRRGDIDGVYSALRSSDVVIITLGLVQSWYDTEDGLYLNRMPGPRAMKNHPRRYTLRILDFETSLILLRSAIGKLVAAGRDKVLLTVSPVPLQKTFSGMDAVMANCYSKSVLRNCVDSLQAEFRQVDYFPSYEMVLSCGPGAYKDDNVHVTETVVDRITRYMTDLYVH